MAVYHFYMMMSIWVYCLYAFPSIIPLVCIGGIAASLITGFMLILDSTVFCCNPRDGAMEKICCCDCFDVAREIMVYPMAIASALRIVLFLTFIGVIMATHSDGSDVGVEDWIWVLLSIVVFDSGPMVLLTVDWWYYFAKKETNGVFGTHSNPMRCAVGQSVVMMLSSWTFVLSIVEYYDTAERFLYFWPWILHGTVSTAVLIFFFVAERSGSVSENKFTSPMVQMVSRVLGAMMAALLVAVLWFCIDLGIHEDGFFFYLIFFYYAAQTLPSIQAMFSFEVLAPQIRSGMDEVPDQERFPEMEMQSGQTTTTEQ